MTFTVIDATRPRNAEGRKALDLLAGKGKKRCALCEPESMIHAQPATCADFLVHAGVFWPKTVKEPYQFWFFVKSYLVVGSL